MTDPDEHRPLDKDDLPEALAPNFFGSSQGRLAKRRRKIMNEIDRNRRGAYKVPTWVLAACLVLFIAAWAVWIIFA
jgi:hypothetical protein